MSKTLMVKFGSLVIVLLIACGSLLFGCKASPTPAVTPSPTPTVKPTVTSPTPQPPIKIGLVSCYTGAYSAFARSSEIGATMAIEEINEAGGLLGRKLELLTRDDALKADLAASHTKELILDKKVNFLLGSVSSGCRVAMSPLSKANKVPMLDWIAGSQRLTWDLGHDYYYTLAGHTALSGYAGAVALAALPTIKTLVVLAPDYEWGRLLVEAFMKHMKSMRPDVQITKELWFKPGESDFTPLITSVLAMKPDAVFGAPGVYDAVNFIKQAKPYGLFDKTTYYQGVCDVWLLQTLKEEMPSGVLGWDPLPLNYVNTPQAKALVDKFKARTGIEIPDYFVGGAYDSVNFIRWGVEKAGTLDPDAFRKAVAGAIYPGIRGQLAVRAIDNALDVSTYTGVVKQNPSYPFKLMTDIVETPGKKAWLSDEEIIKLRQAAK